MNSTAVKVTLLIGLVLLVALIVAGVVWALRRKRRAASSRFGFTADRSPAPGPTAAPLKLKQDETFVKTENFIRKRGQQIVDVLVDYATVKDLKPGVYMARPRPNSCVWWIGEKHPNGPKSVVAAVHVGLGTVHGFRSKVVVLSEASEADTLSRALARAARPRSTPTRYEGWNMPIAFPGFPLRPGDGIAIDELRAPQDDKPAD